MSFSGHFSSPNWNDYSDGKGESALVFKKMDTVCLQGIKKFKEKNKELFENNIVQSFLQNEKHRVILTEAICNPTKENNEALDVAFKKFYFYIRFTSFISSTLYFNAINFDKRHRKVLYRHPLTVDKPLKKDEDSTFKDFIVDSKSEIQIDDILNSDRLSDYIIDPALYRAIETLTARQKQIIFLTYVKGLTDTEIATLLNKTQQSISKTHQKALQNMYQFLKTNKEVK